MENTINKFSTIVNNKPFTLISFHSKSLATDVTIASEEMMHEMNTIKDPQEWSEIDDNIFFYADMSTWEKKDSMSLKDWERYLKLETGI